MDRKRIFFLISCMLFFCGAGIGQVTPSFTFDITLDTVGWRGSRAGEVPGSVTETYSYDEVNDIVTVDVVFDRIGFAPLPPMLAIAYDYGFPITFNKAVVDTGQYTRYGPLKGFTNTDNYTYQVTGLGKYVLSRPALGTTQPPALPHLSWRTGSSRKRPSPGFRSVGPIAPRPGPRT